MRLLLIIFILIPYFNLWANTKLDEKLITCAEAGDLKCVKSALDQGANIMATDSWGENSLHLAIIKGNTELARFLINKDPSIEHLTSSSRWNSPIHHTATRGRLEIMRLLVEKHPNPNYIMTRGSGQNIPLHYAAEHGELEIVQFLIEKHPAREHILAKNEYGKIALHISSAADQGVEVTQFLIRQYPDLDHIMTKDTYGRTPLHLAAKRGGLESVKLLTKLWPTAKHLLSENYEKKTAFEDAIEGLFINRKKVARIIFGSAPHEVKKQFVKICQKNTKADQEFCEQLVISLERGFPQTSGGYQ